MMLNRAIETDAMRAGSCWRWHGLHNANARIELISPSLSPAQDSRRAVVSRIIVSNRRSDILVLAVAQTYTNNYSQHCPILDSNILPSA
jgi:hypothetical protein